MKEINLHEMNTIVGAGDPLTDSNSDIVRQIMMASFIGAMNGVPAGIPGMALGAVRGATGCVGSRTAAHMPVNVQIPRVPMGPVWNGSRR